MMKWKFGSTVIAGAAASLLFLNCADNDYGEVEAQRETETFENERYGAADEGLQEQRTQQNQPGQPGLQDQQGLLDQPEVQDQQYGDNQMGDTSDSEVFGNEEVFGDGDAPEAQDNQASQTFDNWDADKDERLTRQEFSEKFFQEFDTDKNGALDKEEWMSFSEGLGMGSQTGTPASRPAQ